MMTQPVNIQEFSTIAGMVLSAAYGTFPIRCDVSFEQIASSMGIESMQAALPSGRTFVSVAANTLQWLIQNDYVDAAGTLPKDRVTLTAKGMAAMMTRLANGGFTIGETMTSATSSANTSDGRIKFADLMGSFVGSAASSFTKGIAGA